MDEIEPILLVVQATQMTCIRAVADLLPRLTPRQQYALVASTCHALKFLVDDYDALDRQYGEKKA